MSHFTVLVIGANPEKQLAPFQENNMDNCPKEYLVFNSMEEELRKDYDTDEKGVESVYYNSIEIYNEDDFDTVYNAYHPTFNEAIIPIDGTEVKVAPVEITINETFLMIDLNRYELYDFYIRSNNTKDKKQKSMTVRIHSVNKLDMRKEIISVNRVDEPKNVMIKDEMSFKEYAEDYCGYELDKEKGEYGYWENPNRKWDWYQLGGRWNGYFQLKPAAQLPYPLGAKIGKFANNFGLSEGEMAQFFNLYKNDMDKFEKIVSKYDGKSQAIRDFMTEIPEDVEPDDIALAYRAGVIGVDGTFGSHRDSYVGRADAANVEDIDFDAMMDQAGNKARDNYKSVFEAFGGNLPKIEKPWSEFLADESLDFDMKREMYHAQPALVRVKEVANAWQEKVGIDSDEYHKFSFGFDLDDYQCTEEEYVERARQSAISTFAVLKDGKWYEKGDMGWWGFVGNEKEQKSWNDEFSSHLKELPNGTRLSVYDCHI